MKQTATPGTDVASGLIVPFLLATTPIAYFKIFRIIRRHQQQIRTIENPENFCSASNYLDEIQEICVLDSLRSSNFLHGLCPYHHLYENTDSFDQ